jgi:putative transposase
MSKRIPLEFGKFYHVYNRGINRCNIFLETDNYKYFLSLYNKYVPLVADTYAWVLMKNHFHFLVRIKDECEIQFLPAKNQTTDRSGRPCQVSTSKDPSGFSKPDGVFTIGRKPVPERQFGHLFNAYAKAFNKKFNRTGTLFERSFKRIQVNHEEYFKILVYYIHSNPIHHGYVDDLSLYPWNSYYEISSNTRSTFKYKEVVDWFGDFDTFQTFHMKNQDLDKINSLQLDNV